MEGWIKLHRRFIEWEWFSSSEMVKLFLFILISANHEDGLWRGIEIKKGQYLTGIKSLSNKTNISEQTIRTCLNKLKTTGEITIKSTNKYSIITICNYETYQSEQKTTNKQKQIQKTINQQATNNKQEYKNEENINNIPEFNFFEELIKLGVENQVAKDWMVVRKTKKASNTETALNAIKKEISISGMSANDCIKHAVKRNWVGFESSWVDKTKIPTNKSWIRNELKM